MEEITERTSKEIVQLFNELWPFTFITPQPAPLKIGIAQDIVDSGLPKDRPFSRNEIQKGLRLYCGVPKYKKKLRDAGRLRIDLDSNPAGQVSPEEAQKARDKLEAVEQTKLDKARAKAEAEAALLAAIEAKKARKQRQAAEKRIKKMVANETPEERIARKKEKEARKRARRLQNGLNRMNQENQENQQENQDQQNQECQQKQNPKPVTVEYRKKRTFNQPG